MATFFCPLLLKSFVHFSNSLPSLGPGCPDGSSFCRISSSGQEKGCFGMGFGVFCVCTYPQKGLLSVFSPKSSNNQKFLPQSWHKPCPVTCPLCNQGRTEHPGHKPTISSHFLAGRAQSQHPAQCSRKPLLKLWNHFICRPNFAHWHM